MKIKFWSWVYRTTGYYHKAIDSIILYSILDEWEKDQDKERTFLHLSVEIGSWQAKHGFYSTSKQVRKRLKRRFK